MEPMDPRIKAGAAWGGVGISKFLEAIGIGSWGDFAAMLAAFYSLLLIGEWVWKKWRARMRKE
jgi:hypothetical protein